MENEEFVMPSNEFFFDMFDDWQEQYLETNPGASDEEINAYVELMIHRIVREASDLGSKRNG